MDSDILTLAKPRVSPPAHVPAALIREVDTYGLDGIEQGFHEAWARLQGPDTPPLIWTPLTGGHWIATRGDLIDEIFKDPESFSSKVIWVPKEAGEKYNVVPNLMDPPEHTPYRKALDKGLNLGEVRKLEGRVRSVAREIIAGFAGAGHCEFAGDFATLFPVRVFLELAALPMEDAPRLSFLAEQIMRPPGHTPEEQAQSLDDANKAFFAYVEPIIAERRGRTETDLITRMVNSEIDGRPISHEKALGLITLLLVGGLDTVVNLLSFMMIHLARHPALVAEMRDDALRLQRGVEEMFRRFPIVSIARLVTRDMTFHGTELKRGELVLLPTALHGLEESSNADAWTLDLGRRNISHSTFGGGPHRCAGLHLARMEVMVTLQEWLASIPEFTIDEARPPVYHAGIVGAVENVHLVWPAG